VDGAHTHNHGGGFDPTPILAIIAGGLFAMFILPVVLAILHVILMILIVTGALAVSTGIAVLTYKVKHRHDVPRLRPRVERFTELPRTPQRALPPATTHVTLTTEQFTELVRRIDRES